MTGANTAAEAAGTSARPALAADRRRLAYALGYAFAEPRSQDELIRFAVAACREVLCAESVAVLLLDRERNELYFPYVADETPAVAARLRALRFPADRGVAGAVLRARCAVRIDDTSADIRFFAGVDRRTARLTRALLAAPLVSARRAFGVIEAVNPLGALRFTDDDLGLLEALAQSLSRALERGSGPDPDAGGAAEPQSYDDLLAAADHPRAHATPGVFRCEGDYWTIAYADRTVRLKASKGLGYVAHLLRHPGQPCLALDLVAGGRWGVGEGAGAFGAPVLQRGACADGLLDAEARSAYRQRLHDLRDELCEAEERNDIGRAAQARHEMQIISQHLAAAIGLGGRARTATSDAERARWAVGKRIRADLRRIQEAHPILGRHFAATISTGCFCSYTPDPRHAPLWIL